MFTISNTLSFVRILLAVPIYHFLSSEQVITALVIIFIAVITDWLDGFFARKFKQITAMGKMLDPIADKVCTITGFIALSQFYQFPVWITAIIITRDILILAGSYFILNKTHFVVTSNIPGKITMFFISLLGVVYLLHIDDFKNLISIITIILIIYSFIMYVIVFFKNIRLADE